MFSELSGLTEENVITQSSSLTDDTTFARNVSYFVQSTLALYYYTPSKQSLGCI